MLCNTYQTLFCIRYFLSLKKCLCVILPPYVPFQRWTCTIWDLSSGNTVSFINLSERLVSREKLLNLKQISAELLTLKTMKVKNNKYQLMKMLERKRENTQINKAEQAKFSEKEIDEFRKKNGLPRLSKPVKAKNKLKNGTNLKNNVKVMFQENNDYGETEEIKVSFDSVDFQTKSKKHNNNISVFPQKGAGNATKYIKLKNKTETVRKSKISKDNEIEHKKTNINTSQVENGLVKKAKKKMKSNKKKSENIHLQNGSENDTNDNFIKKLALSKTPYTNKLGGVNKLQQRMMQKYTQSQFTAQKEDKKVALTETNRTSKIKEVHVEKVNLLEDKDALKVNKVALQGVKKNKKKDKLKKLLENAASSIKPSKDSGNKLRERMMEKLKAAQFRYLNERLYTSTGSEAQQLFASDPAAFTTYHQGYQLQVSKWPLNPLDAIVKKILKMPKSHIIADMGCGEATLSARVPQTVHSLDLVATSPRVTACDMARTPLQMQSVDVAVYCLSLMGNQLTKYLKEANRVLKIGGRLLIAEVESRFDDVNAFTRDVERLGFKLKNLDQQHQVFFFLDFEKVRDAPAKMNKLPEITLKPCLYKRR